MTVLSCPLCGFKVNALTLHCPECGANPRLPVEEAQSDMRSRGLSLPRSWEPAARRPWTLRRRLLVVTVAVLMTMALVAPYLAGYFGPQAAAYATIWRPWRSHLSVRYIQYAGPSERPQRVMLEMHYRDPWPGQARSPGWQVEFVFLKRVSPWLPWLVTERGSGP